MTSIAGYFINGSPCCGARYRTARYRSMNFSAWEYWTDGYREGSLMPSGHGLRRCKCGNFFILSELIRIDQADETDIPYPDHVQEQDLPLAIDQARNADIELAARLDYWHYLNHTYRRQYRAHRKAEEAVTRSDWEAANPDPRNWWQRLRKVAPPKYIRPKGSPFTFPPFEPTEEQQVNMKALLDLLKNIERPDLQMVAELHRELGQFAQAEQALHALEGKDQDVASQLMLRLVHERQTAPVRYMV